jgi:hypothetical protein
MRKSKSKPKAIAKIIIDIRYANTGFFPIALAKTESEAALVAGPTARNTNTTPGENPFIKSDIPIGIEEVAQIYIGTATTITRSIPTIPLVIGVFSITDAGKKKEISPAITIPIIK